MIKINLITVRVKRKKRAPANQLFIFAGIFIVEIIALFFWYHQTSKELTYITDKNIELQKKIEELKKVKEEWLAWEEEKKILDRQYQIFESLKNDKIGPLHMFQFLSYVLTRIEDMPQNIQELKSLELAGWDIRWNPLRLWIQKMSEKDGILTIQGTAIDHEDVAEFYKRVETNPYLLNLEPGLQQQREDKELGLKFVDFTMTSLLNYNVELEGLKIGLR